MLAVLFTVSFRIAHAQDTFTASTSGTWGNTGTWSSSGSDADGIPDGDDNVIIPDGLTVSLSAAQACDDLTINFGGILLFNSQALTINGSTLTDGGAPLTISLPGGNGQWNANANWYGGKPADDENIYIASTINSNVPGTLSGNITISSEGRLEDGGINIGDGATTISLRVDGTLTTTAGSGNNLELAGDVDVSGTGVIDSDGTSDLNGYTITIASSADILFQTSLSGSGGVVENNGSASFASGLTNLTFNNNTDAYVQFQNSTILSLTVDASASGNTVEYAFTDAAATVINTTYHHLTLSTSAGNTLSSSLDVNGDLTISAASTFNSGITLTLGGDWTHTNGTLTYTGSTITFDGSSDQAISSAILSTVSFNNLTINKASGSLTTAENISVEGTLTMTTGNVELDGSKLTLGSSTSSAGTLSYTDGFIVGEYEKWMGSTGTYKFPIGTPSASRLLDVTVNSAALGSLSAQFTSSAPGNSGLSGGLDVNGTFAYNTFAEGYWTLTANNSFASSSYAITAEVEGFSSFEFDDDNDARLLARTATDWITGGQSGSSADASASPKTVSGSGFTETLSSTLDLAVSSAIDCEAVDAAAITGDAAVCTDDVNIYSVSQVASLGTSEFSWEVSEGGLITGYSTDGSGYTSVSPGQESLAGSDYRYVEVTWPSTGTASAAVSVSEKAAGCGYGASSSLAVVIGTVPPAGIEGRTVVAESAQGITYSLSDAVAGYTYTWSVTNGTITSSASGTDLTSITVDWGTVTGTQTVSVTADATGCTTATAVTLSVAVYNVIDSDYSSGSDVWDRDRNWESGVTPTSTESARIATGDYITLNADESIKNLIVNGSLDLSGNTITVSGDIEIYGSVVGPGTIVLSGSSKDIIGTSTSIGSIADNVDFTLQNSNTVYGGTSLSLIGDINLASDASVTNNGSVTIAGDLTGGNTNSTWTNAVGASGAPTSLSVEGELLATGILQADALFNIVVYTGTGSAIKTPSNDTYHHLTITNSTGTRSSSATAFTLTGDLTIASTVDFDGLTDGISLSGSAAQTLDLTGGTVQYGASTGFPSLTINNVAGVTLNSPVTLLSDATLTLSSGVLTTTSTNLLTIGTDGTISGGSSASYVSGPLQHTENSTVFAKDKVYPFGSNGVYRPITLTLTQTNSSSTLYTYTGSLNEGAPPGRTLPVSLVRISGGRYYTITQSPSIAVGAATVTIQYNEDDEADVASSLRIAKSDGAGNWIDLLGINTSLDEILGTYESGTITSSPFTTFSDFALASTEASENPLPVEITSLKAVPAEGGVNVSWVTASETNNSHFIVERSTDAVTFRAIANTEGAGNSSAPQYYESLDNEAPFGTLYYRLRQVDFDGTTSFSKVVSVERDLPGVQIRLWPNPTKDRQATLIATGLDADQEVSVRLLSLSGYNVRTYQAKTDESGNFTLALHGLEPLASGVYTLVATSARYRQITKLVVP